ncbi:hypothetical protein Q7514_11450 [Rhodococcus artemisiae]|uniref:GntR C-terminal domain-containing protein n=1 Tax=Rhodococcus artemisiae TaxID=714159 RepID=A0ABU7L9C5_9NOCA|nr:hypothetical protein [Rhodococcus artemisiae]
MGVQFTKSARRSVLSVHEAIYRTIESRRSDEAEAAMKHHMRETAAYFEEKFPNVMDQVVAWELHGR